MWVVISVHQGVSFRARAGQPAAPNHDQDHDLMEPPETIYVEDATIGCDGGGGPQGHPKVFLNLAGKEQADCPYCGRRFVARATGDEGGDGGDGDGG